MIALSPDTGEAARFLKWLDPDPAAEFHFLTFDDDKARHDRRLVLPSRRHPERLRLDQLVGLNQRGAGVFIAPNRFRAGSTRRMVESVESIRALWSDLDGVPLHEAELHLPPALSPTLIVQSSPGHFHLYWMVEDDFPLGAFKAAQVKLAELTGGDMGVAKNAAQGVLRLPGFFHCKGEPFRTFVDRIPARHWSRYSGRFVLDMLGLSAESIVSSSAHKPAGGFEPLPVELLRLALSCLDPRDFAGTGRWITLAMAAHHMTGGEGADVFMEWSAGDPRYEGHGVENLRRWNTLSFRENVVTMGTLVHALRELDRDEADEVADRIVFHDDILGGAAEPGPIPEEIRAMVEADAWDFPIGEDSPELTRPRPKDPDDWLSSMEKSETPVAPEDDWLSGMDKAEAPVAPENDWLSGMGE